MLPAAIDLIYMITNNLKTENGSVNGAICTLKRVENKGQKTTILSILWVKFHDKHIKPSAEEDITNNTMMG